MKQFQFAVTVKDTGLRLDQFILKNLSAAEGISRSKIQQLIKTGNIRLKEHNNIKAHYKVRENDLVVITIPAAEKIELLPEDIPLEIIYEDTDLLVINKPCGMVTHPAAGNFTHTLVNALLHYGCSLSTVNGPARPGIVHRLDKDTSGLIVVAKNDYAHHNLAKQFRNHTVLRKYIAIVKGHPAQNEGIIDYPLARHPGDRKKIAVSFNRNAKSALTRYKVLKRLKDATLIELCPYTGRTHQLRVHLKFCGHPILGDQRYGSGTSFERMALHATIIGFVHPRTGKPVEFHIDIPEGFKKFLAKMA